MARLFGIDLQPAAVRESATFREAAEILVSYPVSTIAVLDEEGRVIGLFGGDDLLEGLFPAYLQELHHTAFLTDDAEALDRRAEEAAAQPVRRYMDKPITVELTTSATHVAERFLHCEYDALPVLSNGSFVGMLGRSEFCRAVLRRRHRLRPQD